jgi:L-alanine-DL-glutamate epimerase-like enolase superfamily enzyme
MRLADFCLTRFQFRRDRIIGDSQVRVAEGNFGALELIAEDGTVGLGFFHALFHPLPALAEVERLFREEAWPRLEGDHPAAIVNRVGRPRGGNSRRMSLPFEEAINQACWDLAGKALGLPLWRLLGGRDPKVRGYASGLDFHLSDAHFSALFRSAAEAGYQGFKIKVGHPDVAWDVHRLGLLREATGGRGAVMVDANEAWTPKEALRRLDIYRRAGFDILWVEDPCLRDDFAGLREIRNAAPYVHVNSGEYLDLHGKRLLLDAGGADILNVHGLISDVMRAGWLAAEHGIEVSLGNTTLEIGVHLAAALPEARWMEYSFQNYNHLVEEPVAIVDGYLIAPDRPGHGLALGDEARRVYAAPEVLPFDRLPPVPDGSPFHFNGAGEERPAIQPTNPTERRIHL